MSACCSCCRQEQGQRSSAPYVATVEGPDVDHSLSQIHVVVDMVDGARKTDRYKCPHGVRGLRSSPLAKPARFSAAKSGSGNIKELQPMPRCEVCFTENFVSGRIKFKAMDRSHLKHTRSKFLALRPSDDADAVIAAMEQKWNLQFPKLLICILGGESLTPAYQTIEKHFRKSLVEAILSTDVWLFTGGLNCGLMRSIGQALTSYAIGRAMVKKRDVVAVGIAPLGSVGQGDKLLGSEKRSEYNLVVGEKEEESGASPQEGGDQATPAGTHHLEPNHTHFILVGDQHSTAGDEVKLRTKLVNKIAQSQIKGSTAKVPVVYLVFGGDASAIETVCDAVQSQKIPVIIAAGSGGAADVLSVAIDQWQKHQCPTRTDIFESNIKIAQVMKMELRLDQQDHIRQIKKQLEEIVKRRHLINIYRHEVDIEEAILGALRKAKHGCKDRDYLHLAVIWNRIDLARKDLLNHPKWKDEELRDSLLYALVNNQHKFVKLFLDEGRIDPRRFLTVPVLRSLYEQVCKTSPLYMLLKEQKDKRIRNNYKESGVVQLRDIGNLLKKLIFETYNPMYDEDDIYTNKDKRHFVDPFRELFLWAVLCHRYQLAKLFWKRGRTPIGGALVGYKLLRSLSEIHTVDLQEAAKMMDHAKDFERAAVELLSHCFAEDRRRTLLLLVRELPAWGGFTCLELAAEARSKRFIAHPAVQNLLNELWMGRLSRHTGLFRIWSCILCPLAAPFALTYMSKIDHSVPADHKFADNETQDSTDGPSSSEEIQNTKLPNSISRSGYVHYNVANEEVDDSSGIHTYLPPRQPIRRGQSLSVLYRFKLFLEAPVISFRLNMISYFIFLGLFSYILLANFHEEISIYEMVLAAWVFTFFTEEVRQVLQEDFHTLYHRLVAWFWGYWNCIDLVSLLLFALGFCLRLHRRTLPAARIVLALDLIVFYLRILHILSASKILGPKLIMIIKMLVDLVTFLAILLVFMIAYGVACQSILFPNTTDVNLIMKGVLYQSYFQLYGELFLDDINEENCAAGKGNVRCPEHPWFGEIVLAVYLFISNILLLNLLIAMLNYTFQAIQENTDTFWKFQRYQLVKEYYQRPSVFPPFIIISHIYQVVRWTWDRCCPRCPMYRSPNLMKKTLPEEREIEITIWEEVKGEDYLAEKKQSKGDPVKRMKLAEEKLESVLAKMSKYFDGGQLNRAIEGRFNELSAEIARLEQLLGSQVGPETEVDAGTDHFKKLRHMSIRR